MDFLLLYGSFAGEDLVELDEDEEDFESDEESFAPEDAPLLGNSAHQHRQRDPKQGTATVTQAVMMVIFHVKSDI